MQDALDLMDGETDAEMKEMAREEFASAKQRQEELAQQIRILLIPKDPNDDKNVIVEIRAGAGGDEAALFAAEIFRMYARYAEMKGWKCDVVNTEEIGIGGMKYVEFIVEGNGAYSKLKYESGVHRVQRVPVTESGGRIHTSTCTVAVMPEVEDDVKIDIPPEDIRIDITRASGNGGQGVNTTDSHDAEADLRRSQIGTGDRSEKIRTYNFPQSRVTDHRIKLTLYNLDEIMNGHLDEIIDALTTADQQAKLLRMGQT